MPARPALFTARQNPSVPPPVNASDARFDIAAAFAKWGIAPRTGVVWAGNPFLLQATASMVLQVFPLHFVQSKLDSDGVYIGGNDSIYNLTIAAPPGSGSRTDKVYIMQQDANSPTSPDASTASVIAATSGAIPAGAVQIGTVVIPAGITKLTDAGVVITTNCRWTAAAGAPVPVNDVTDRGTLNVYTGLQALRLDAGGVIDTYDGTAWRSAVWTNFAPVLYSAAGATVIGSSLNYARYRYRDPHTVEAQVDIARVAGGTVTDGLAVSLPVPAVRRYLNCGSLVVAGATAPTNQSSIAFMSGDATKLIPVSYTNGYLSVDPLMNIRYSVTYEV